MKRAFTLIEVLCVLAIVALLATLLYPVAMQARERALETVTASRLRHIGVALNLYRSDWNGASSGSRQEMGLPTQNVWQSINLEIEAIRCASLKNVPFLDGTRLFSLEDPQSELTPALSRDWRRLSVVHGEKMPFVGMLCHNSPSLAQLYEFQPLSGLSVNVNGELVRTYRRGNPGRMEWWINP